MEGAGWVVCVGVGETAGGSLRLARGSSQSGSLIYFIASFLTRS